MPEFRRTEHAPQFHRLLLRVAGHAPDDVLADARYALAQGRIADVAAAVASITVNAGLALTDEEFALVAAVDPDAVAALSDTRPDQWPLPPVEFQPALADPAVFAPEAPPPMLDLTDAPAAFVGTVTDDVDRAAVAAVERVPGATALWRSWRFTVPAGPDAPATRVFVLSTAVATADLPVVTARLQTQLGTTGTTIEVYVQGEALPAYQMQARGAAALLWTATEPRPITVARVFDGVDAVTGPWFDDDHPRLGGPDRDHVLAFLDAGRPVLTTTQRMADLVDPGRGAVVPMSYRTDGSWVWTDTVSYYLREHGLAPDPGLLYRARSTGALPADTDEIAEHRVLAALFRPAAASPAALG
ncbi:hypothetical protein ACFFKH_10040 [Micromonospora marina]|uniref:Uncharacterized protein n=1 Tax=Micromonospora marina TaxID=307120 RepID=A0A1C4ZD78_9ACTN|nr:hypothetical protein [Micromonospora marina]SCF30933.1 hypothetical protein GA0070215_11661 [Micromonospora marina]